jgi:voltage-gated potassium channel Kch
MKTGRTPDEGAAAGWAGWLRSQDAALSLFVPLLLGSTVLSWPLRALAPGWAFDTLAVVTVLLGVLVLVPNPRHAVVAGGFALAVLVQRVVGYGRGTLVETLPELAFFVLVAAALAARVFRPGRITVHRLLGAVALFVVLGVCWGMAYQAVDLTWPGSIRTNGAPASPQDAMWMSFITLTTVGYGEVVPISHFARSLASMEALTGVLFPSVLIGLLLADFSRSRPRDHDAS